MREDAPLRGRSPWEPVPVLHLSISRLSRSARKRGRAGREIPHDNINIASVCVRRVREYGVAREEEKKIENISLAIKIHGRKRKYTEDTSR